MGTGKRLVEIRSMWKGSAKWWKKEAMRYKKALESVAMQSCGCHNERKEMDSCDIMDNIARKALRREKDGTQ